MGILVILVIGGVFEGELDDYLVNRDGSVEIETAQGPDLSDLSCEEIIEMIQERRASGDGFGGGNEDRSEFDGEPGGRGGVSSFVSATELTQSPEY